MPITHKQLALYQQLSRKSVRQAEGLWLVEGPNAVRSALNAGLSPVVLLSAEAAVLNEWVNAGIAAETIGLNEMGRIATTDSPPPVVGIFQARRPVETTLPDPKSGEYWLGLHGLQDPGNVGTLIRCARAFGAAGILTTPNTVDVYSPKVIRATAGEVFFAAVYEGVQMKEAWPMDLPVWATRARNAVPYASSGLKSGGLLLLGSEGSGISEGVLYHSFNVQWVCIPQNPAVDSLNVAVSGAILMAQWYS